MAEVLLEKVEAYWTGRAQGYSLSNAAELDSDRYRAWESLIARHTPEGKTLRILDVGTGPGFLAIVMSGLGHRVTAVDCTEAMLDEAKENAAAWNRDIDFFLMDAQTLSFEEGAFDLVISRNLTWNLKSPRTTYEHFHRILCPGGRLLNFDANWYLYLYNAKARAGWERDRKNMRRLGCPDHYDSATARRMEAIARDLPLSRVCRPEWDVDTLTDIGFSKLSINPSISDYVWDGNQKVNFGSTPLFMIEAEK